MYIQKSLVHIQKDNTFVHLYVSRDKKKGTVR